MGAALRTSSIYYCCVIREKDIFQEVECFYWKKLSCKSFSFESEQFFDLCIVLAVLGCSADNIQYIPLLCCKTK